MDGHQDYFGRTFLTRAMPGTVKAWQSLAETGFQPYQTSPSLDLPCCAATRVWHDLRKERQRQGKLGRQDHQPNSIRPILESQLRHGLVQLNHFTSTYLTLSIAFYHTTELF